ncbi:MAG: YidC/Oxa1 family membrane protein insertase [Treponema sp.]|nr:YidC/Oxa1 family membrane protein insertase [Treponema sp.]
MRVPEILYAVILHPVHIVLELVYSLSSRFFSEDGLAVICMSLVMNLLLLPIYNKADSLRDKVLAKQKAMKRGVDHIKACFSGDERFFMLSEYYAQNHYSPLSSLLPSLPLLMQLPFFMVAYSFLSTLRDLNCKDFLFIEDLGRCDALISFPHFTLNVLPIVMTAVNCISGAIYTKGHGLREKVQVYALAAIFLVLLYGSPSGLVLYWTCNNLFSLGKNLVAHFRSGRSAVVDGTPESAGSGTAGRTAPVPSTVKEGHGRAWTGLFLLSCLLLCLQEGLALPTALISSSVAEFSAVVGYENPIHYALLCLAQAGGLFVFWPLAIYCMFSDNVKVQRSMALTLAVIALFSVCNAYAFPGNYGDVSNSLQFLNEVDFKSVSLFSLLNFLCLLAIAGLVLFAIRKGRGALVVSFMTAIVLALSAFSLFNSVRICTDYGDYRASVERNRVEEVKPVFQLSRNHPNVVLIMLDRAQAQLVEEIFTEAPELKESFAGFTFYENTLSFNGHTLLGLPPLFGGYEYTPAEMNRRAGEPLAEKNNQSQLLLPLILKDELGFKGVIADPQYGNYSLYCDTTFIDPYGPDIRGCQTMQVYSPFWYREKNVGGLSDPRTDTIRRNLLFFSFFRSVPVCIRPFVYQGGDYWSTALFSDMAALIDSYSVLDYLKELTSVEETDGGRYFSLVNELTHCEEFLQAPDYIPVNEVTVRSTSSYNDWNAYYPQMAAFKLLASWLDYLRSEGVYENTRIIIASDHGCRGEERKMEKDKDLDRKVTGGNYHGRGHYHPLLLFKDFGAGEGFVHDRESFMTNADAPSLLLKGLVERPVNPFTGKEIPTDTRPLKEGGVVISASDAHKPAENGIFRYSIQDDEWWQVVDPVYAASSWTQPGPPEGTK